MYKGLEAALGTPFSSDPLSPPPNPIVLVISGPSGVGKDAVIKVTELFIFYFNFCICQSRMILLSLPLSQAGKDFVVLLWVGLELDFYLFLM